MPNLVDKIIELEKELTKIQDESIRQDLQRQIDDLKTKYQAEIETLQKELNKSKETKPIYFDRETDVLKEFYERVDGGRISIDFKGLDRKGYYDRKSAEELLRKKVISLAKEKGHDAIFVQESKEGGGFDHKMINNDFLCRVSADVYFYKKRENAATHQ